MHRLIYTFLILLLLPLLGMAQTSALQPYHGNSRSDYPDPDPIKPGSIDFDDIHVWAGEGDNRSALVIQWSVAEARFAYVFGYRWDSYEQVTSIDMIKAVVPACSRLYGAWTDGGTYGSVINGFGWDPQNDGNFSVTLKDGTVVKGDDDGSISAGAPELDGAVPTSPRDWFEGGWYDGYWSFWVMEAGDTSMYYSQVGASSRVLTDGCVDGWMFAPRLITDSWKTWVAAPADTEPDPATGQESASISNIDSEQCEPVYYNLQGIRLDSPGHGICIERRGSEVRKVMIP